MSPRWVVLQQANEGLQVLFDGFRDNDVVPFHALQLWPVFTAVSVHSPTQILYFDPPVVRQRVVRCLVNQGAELGCTGSRRPVREFLQVEAFPWLPAELCVQNFHPGGLIWKIDT